MRGLKWSVKHIVVVVYFAKRWLIFLGSVKIDSIILFIITPLMPEFESTIRRKIV